MPVSGSGVRLAAYASLPPTGWSEPARVVAGSEESWHVGQPRAATRFAPRSQPAAASMAASGDPASTATKARGGDELHATLTRGTSGMSATSAAEEADRTMASRRRGGAVGGDEERHAALHGKRGARRRRRRGRAKFTPTPVADDGPAVLDTPRLASLAEPVRPSPRHPCSPQKPHVCPLFCVSSHVFSGAKYSSMALASALDSPEMACMASGHGLLAPRLSIALSLSPAALFP